MRPATKAILCAFLASPAVAAAPDWQRVRRASEACHVRLVRQELPIGLEAVPHAPAYRFASDTPPEKRQCFYHRLGMSDVERLLRERQFQQH